MLTPLKFEPKEIPDGNYTPEEFRALEMEESVRVYNLADAAAKEAKVGLEIRYYESHTEYFLNDELIYGMEWQLTFNGE